MRASNDHADALRRLLEKAEAELAERDARIGELEKRLHESQELITQWKETSGLVTSGGDPDGITPEDARKFWEGIETERDAGRKTLRALAFAILDATGGRKESYD